MLVLLVAGMYSFYPVSITFAHKVTVLVVSFYAVFVSTISSVRMNVTILYPSV